MKDQLEKRLTDLKAEFSSGQKMLAELEVKEAALRETLLRVSGAIQVLEEELNKNQVSLSDEDAAPVIENG